jgi:hypothetical protein
MAWFSAHKSIENALQVVAATPPAGFDLQCWLAEKLRPPRGSFALIWRGFSECGETQRVRSAAAPLRNRAVR